MKNDKSIYIKALCKFWKKKLKHIKKPRIRKRKIVQQYAFATAVHYGRMSAKTAQISGFSEVMEQLKIRLENELKSQGHELMYTVYDDLL